MRRVGVVGFAIAVTACTWNASSLEHELTSVSDEAPFVALRVDVESVGVPFPVGTTLTVQGATRESAAVSLELAGVTGGGVDASEIAAGFDITWPVDAEGVRALDVAYDWTAAGTIFVRRTQVEMPHALDLEVVAHEVDVEVLDVEGVATVTTAFGAIEVATAGPLVARSAAGAVRGSFAGGGSIITDAGDIEVELASVLARDLVIEAGSGAVRLGLPAEIAGRLEARSERGRVLVQAGGLAGDGNAVSGALGAGGPFIIRITTTNGAIDVYERSGS